LHRNEELAIAEPKAGADALLADADTNAPVDK
jgi:hypothetical protein